MLKNIRDTVKMASKMENYVLDGCSRLAQHLINLIHIKNKSIRLDEFLYDTFLTDFSTREDLTRVTYLGTKTSN